MSDAVTSVTRVGFVGLGNMGQPMVMNLLKAGHELTIYDVRTEAGESLIAAGARWAPSPKAVAHASAVTFTALPGPREIEEAVLGPNGVLEGAHESDHYVDVSTSTPATIERIAESAARKGVRVLDAPVSGGVRGARKATLVFMVGGDRTAFEHCEPILKQLGEKVFYMGSLGSGYVTKLVNNYMGMSNALASMEAVVLGVKAGVDVHRLLEVIDSGTGSSYMTKTLYPYLILKRNFEPTRFSIELGAKDFRLAVELANAVGVPVRIGEAVAEALASAERSGLAHKDLSTYITLLEKASGVEVKG